MMILRPAVGDRALEHRQLERNPLFHERESGFVVIADAEEPRPCSRCSSATRARCSARRTCRARPSTTSSASVTWLPWVTAKQPAFDAAATAVGRVRVDPRALARALLPLRTSPRSARRSSSVSPPSRMLFDANSLMRSAPSARAADPHVANLVRRTRVLVELVDRREQARAGQLAARDGAAQIDVRRATRCSAPS